jgi:hypothetical protein
MSSYVCWALFGEHLTDRVIAYDLTTDKSSTVLAPLLFLENILILFISKEKSNSVHSVQTYAVNLQQCNLLHEQHVC